MGGKLLGLLAAPIIAIVMIFSSLLLIVFMVIWVILSNYEMCSLPYEKECWKPDRVYEEDPIMDVEILDMVYGEDGMINTRERIIDQNTIYHYSDLDGKLNLKVEDGFTLSGPAQAFIKDIPILDAASVRRVNEEEKNLRKELAESKNNEDDVIFDSGEEEKPNTDVGSVYKITDSTTIDDEMRKKLESLLYRTDVKSEGRGNRFAELKGSGILDVFIDAGIKNGIDPVFLIAVSVHEAGNGTSFSLHSRNNVGGIRCPELTKEQKEEFGYERCEESASNGKFSVWKTVEGSIKYKAYLLNKAYANDAPPKLTVFDVGMKYAPLSDNKDPNALNNHWVGQVGQRLLSLGINNVGSLGIDGIMNLAPSNSTVRPSFDKYNFAKVFYTKGVPNNPWDLIGDDYWDTRKKQISMNATLRGAKDSVKIRAGLVDKTKTEAQKTLDEEINGFYKNIKVDDAMISEAELQLRTTLQFDLDGMLGENHIHYETAHAMLRLKRQVENAQKGYTKDDFNSKVMFYKMQNEEPINSELLSVYRDSYIELLKDIDVYDNGLTEEGNIEKSLNVKESNRNFILNKSARSDELYPFLAIVLDKTPTEYNKELGIEIIEKFEEYVKEKNIEPKLLSTLTVGRLLKRNASAYFVSNYMWFSLDKEQLEKEFEEYVTAERKKANLGVDVVTSQMDKGFWGNVASDIKHSPLAVWNWNKSGKLMTQEYMDMSVKNNIYVKFGVFDKTREMMEIGAFARDTCFYFESYNSQACMIANYSTYGSDVYTWEKSDVLDKTKQNAVYGTVCQYVPDTDGDGVHDHKDFFPGDPTKTKESDAIEVVPKEEPPKEKPKDDGGGENTPRPMGPQSVKVLPEETPRTAVAGWSSGWNWLKTSATEAINKFDKIFDETVSAVKTWTRELTSSIAGTTKVLAPRAPDVNTYQGSVDITDKLKKNLSQMHKDETLEILKNIQEILWNETGIDNVQIGLIDEYGNQRGYVKFSSSGNKMELKYIDITLNREKTYSYEDIVTCDPDTEIKVESFSKDLRIYYPTTYEIMAMVKDMNLYHTKLSNKKNTEADFKKDVLAMYREMVNVDYVDNESFLKEFDEYLTNRSPDFAGESGGFSSGSFEADPGIIAGIEVQMPVISNPVRLTSLMGGRSCAGCSSNHKGNDITSNTPGKSVPIVAFADATLYQKTDNGQYNSGMGNYVVLKHSTGKGTIYTRYLHMVTGSVNSALSAYNVGDSVPRGTQIGMMGTTGASNGIHLHLDVIQSEVYDPSRKVNPTPFLPITPENSVCSNGVNKPEVCKEMGLRFQN